MASVGEVDLAVVPELSQFGALLLSGVSKTLGPVESMITSKLGLALGGAFAVFSVSQATQFETSMNRLIGLVGLSQQEVDSLSNSILNLGGVLPQSPKELADALFFIESAGQRGAQALDTLTVSAEASAAGLGTTKVVADAVTSAMNTYAKSGLTAAHATDIMIAAVREGKLAPELFASQLGQVLPVASQLGITFDQVAAAIASSTREGLTAARAATGTRFLISSFIRPTAASVSALNSVGKSVAGIQNELQNRGLLSTMQDLAARFDLTTAKGREMFATVVGGTRGMAVAAILVGENGKAVQQIFNDVADSAGSLATAWNAASQTLKVQIGQVVSAVEAMAIRFGTALLPAIKIVISALKFVLTPLGDLITFLTKIPGLVSGVALAFVSWKVLTFAARALDAIVAKFASFRGGATVAEEAMTETGAVAEVTSGQITSLTAAINTLAETLGAEIPAASEAADIGLAGFGETATGLIVPVEAATEANIELAGSEELAAGNAGLFAGALSGAAGVIVPLLAGFVAIKTEIGYFNGLSEKARQTVSNLTTSITSQTGTLGALQQNLGLTNDQFQVWLTQQRLGVNTASAASAAFDNYQQQIGTRLQDTLSAVTKIRQPMVVFGSSLGQIVSGVGAVGVTLQQTKTLWDVYGQGLQNSADLTNQNKLNIAQQIGYLAALGGGLGDTATKELQFAEKTGEATNILNLLDDKIAKLAPSLNDTQKALISGGLNFRQYADEASVMGQTVGTSFAALSAQAHQVFVSDGNKFGDNWDKFTSGIVDSYMKAQQAITTGIDFLGTKMQDLFSQKSFSASDILKSIQSATAATVNFGKNLSEIAGIGQGKGRALSQWLASLGPDGARAAAKVAGASADVQASIVAAYNKNRQTVQSTSDQISTKILGTLQSMLDLLKKVAQQEWGVTLNTKGNAMANTQTLADRLAYLGSHPTTIAVQATVKGFAQTPGSTTSGALPPPFPTGGGGGNSSAPPDNGASHKPRPTGTSTGGVIHGETGFITKRPTYLVGEGSYPTKAFRGSEAVIPLNARGRKFIRDAWGMDDHGQPRVQKMKGELTLTEDSRAYIRAVIMEEVTGSFVDQQLAREVARRRP